MLQDLFIQVCSCIKYAEDIFIYKHQWRLANIQKSFDCVIQEYSLDFCIWGQIFWKKKKGKRRKRRKKERKREYHQWKRDREVSWSWRSSPPQAFCRRIFWNGKVTDSYVINFPPAPVQLRENQMSQWPRTYRIIRLSPLANETNEIAIRCRNLPGSWVFGFHIFGQVD